LIKISTNVSLDKNIENFICYLNFDTLIKLFQFYCQLGINVFPLLNILLDSSINTTNVVDIVYEFLKAYILSDNDIKDTINILLDQIIIKLVKYQDSHLSQFQQENLSILLKFTNQTLSRLTIKIIENDDYVVFLNEIFKIIKIVMKIYNVSAEEYEYFQMCNIDNIIIDSNVDKRIYEYIYFILFIKQFVKHIKSFSRFKNNHLTFPWLMLCPINQKIDRISIYSSRENSNIELGKSIIQNLTQIKKICGICGENNCFNAVMNGVGLVFSSLGSNLTSNINMMLKNYDAFYENDTIEKKVVTLSKLCYVGNVEYSSMIELCYNVFSDVRSIKRLNLVMSKNDSKDIFFFNDHVLFVENTQYSYVIVAYLILFNIIEIESIRTNWCNQKNLELLIVMSQLNWPYHADKTTFYLNTFYSLNYSSKDSAYISHILESELLDEIKKNECNGTSEEFYLVIEDKYKKLPKTENQKMKSKIFRDDEKKNMSSDTTTATVADTEETTTPTTTPAEPACDNNT
ncbi:hypothetical protein A3Q56_03327, partial [Intoshia linei]